LLLLEEYVMSVVSPFPIPPRLSTLVLAAALSSGIVGCSNSGENTDHDHDAHSVTIYGSAFAAPVNGASCTVKNTSGTTLVGPATTGTDGSYSLQVHEDYLENDVRVECTGGSYVDEATGNTVAIAGKLSVYIAGNTLADGSEIHATPASTIIAELVSNHSKTLSEAETLFTNAYGFTPHVGTAPTDATNPATGATDHELLAGLRAAAFSQMGADLGLTAAQQFDLLTALAQDLSDGQMDGADMSGAITIPGTATLLMADMQNRFGTAMLNFRDGGNDMSGLGNDKIGNLPFAKMAMSDNYRLEYIPGSMAAMQGKTQFQIRVTDAATGMTPQSGLTLSLMPMMHMAMHTHSTPVEGCSESTTAGTYDCTLYYLMASQMMNGDSMGYWDLKVMLGGMQGESAHFYPSVMMAMGDSTRATLKGVNDEISGMNGAENRSYYLFKSDLSGMTGNHSFQLFLAAKESMMSYPAVSSGGILNSGDASYELTISSISVEVSTDATTWVSATEDGNGYWTATGLTGLSDGTQGELYVRLSVNGEQKSTDGNMASGANGYATLLVTPGGI
jgi:hypothetical protein